MNSNDKQTMKRILILSAIGLVGMVSSAVAQNGDGNHPNDYKYAWSNYFSFNHSNDYNYEYAWGTNCWWTNGARWGTNAVPLRWGTNQFGRVIHQAGPPSDRPRRLGQPELPDDVQAMVQQFQRERQRLMEQLKKDNAEQRREVLQQMEQLRLQMRERVSQIREQARQQAEQMRQRFGNNRDQILDQGKNGEPGGNGGTRGR